MPQLYTAHDYGCVLGANVTVLAAKWESVAAVAAHSLTAVGVCFTLLG